MKRLIIMLVLLAIIWALNAYSGIYIDNSSKKLLVYIDEAKAALQAQDVGRLNEQIKQLRDEWEQAESHWEVLVDHKEIDRVDTLMTHVEAMGRSGSLDEILPELEELAFYITHIDDKHKIRPENILQARPSAPFWADTALSSSARVDAVSS